MVSIQTFGNRAGNPKPHLHCLATNGVFLPDGCSFVASPFLPPVDIAELFRWHLLRAFVERELLSESVAENMLSWPHSGFHVHLGPLIGEDEGELLGGTARYCARAPLSLSRLTYDRDVQMITYGYTNPFDNTEATERIRPLELIARLATHIPDPGERLVHYFGHYANRSRGSRPSPSSTAVAVRSCGPLPA